ncbi:MAG: acyloxyacyl hydrolase [Nonlabens sp.]
MKFLLVLLLSSVVSLGIAQTQSDSLEARGFSLDVNLMRGSILQHNPDISHLITDHPTGLMFSYNRKSYGKHEWESRYNFPDWGVTAVFQDLQNEFLGEAYGLYGHYNFYFLRRSLQLRIGQGIAYMTNPFDVEENPRNNAYGTRLTSSTLLGFNYRREKLLGNLGLHAGFTIVHYSNANFRAPNNSTNTFLFNAGLNYAIDNESTTHYKIWNKRSYKESLHLNIVARAGLNESDFRGSGQFPFYHLSVYMDKRLTLKSSIHLGTELFLSEFLKEYRDFLANSFPEEGLDGNEDYKRVGVFVGHELHLGKTSLITQLGYYLYWPIAFEQRIYNRIGLQRRLGSRFFASLNLHSHGAKAEGVNLGLGYRFKISNQW